MDKVGVETKNSEFNDNRKPESNQIIEHVVTEGEVRASHNNSIDGNKTRIRCHSCCVLCRALWKPCMTKHNPLPASPTRFDGINFSF